MLEETFQQQDRRAHAGLAQFQRFFYAGHGKTVGFRFQRLRTAHRAVAVGVGLDHRQCLAATQLPGQAVVVTQRVQVDQRLRRTHYAASRCGRVLRVDR